MLTRFRSGSSFWPRHTFVVCGAFYRCILGRTSVEGTFDAGFQKCGYFLFFELLIFSGRMNNDVGLRDHIQIFSHQRSRIFHDEVNIEHMRNHNIFTVAIRIARTPPSIFVILHLHALPFDHSLVNITGGRRFGEEEIFID